MSGHLQPQRPTSIHLVTPPEETLVAIHDSETDRLLTEINVIAVPGLVGVTPPERVVTTSAHLLPISEEAVAARNQRIQQSAAAVVEYVVTGPNTYHIGGRKRSIMKAQGAPSRVLLNILCGLPDHFVNTAELVDDAELLGIKRHTVDTLALPNYQDPPLLERARLRKPESKSYVGLARNLVLLNHHT